MPSSLFQKSSTLRDGAKDPPLVDRVGKMDNQTLLNKHANARRKATESFGAVCAGHGANLVTKIPSVGSFIPVQQTVKSGEDHAFRGQRLRERQKVLERALKDRNVQPTRYERSDRVSAFNKGAGKAADGEPARRL